MTSGRPRVLATWRYPEEGLGLLREPCDLEVWPEDRPMTPDELRSAIGSAHGLFHSPATDRVDATLIAAAPRLRVISGFGVGYDNVDVAAATARGIRVCNTPGVLAGAVADQAFALLLAVARRIPESKQLVLDGKWRHWHPRLLVGSAVGGATLGIVGMGGIGAEMARRGAGFGMRILYASRTRKPDVEAATGATFVPLDTLLAESDYVSLHCALTPETRTLIGKKQLARMKPTAVLINTARGAVVDQAALAEALRVGRIGGAGLDVTDPEPISPGDPLLRLDTCLVVPHVASATTESRARMSALACSNILAVLEGREPPHAVNETVAKTTGTCYKKV